MTERRWDAEGAFRWSCSWSSVGSGAGGARYVLVHSRGQRPMRRGWHGGHRGHGHGGIWLPLVLLILFVSFTGFWALLMLLFVALFAAAMALGAYVVGTLIARVLRLVLPGGMEGAARSLSPPTATVQLEAPAPYRLSGGSLAATGGPDLYRKRLLEVLQQRYVRGEISLSEFEARAGRIARDPSARHLS